MSRLSRKNRTPEDLGIKFSGGLIDLFDNAIKEMFRITDDEFDYLAEHISEDDMNVVFKENPSFTEKRQCLLIVEKYLTEYNEQNGTK